MPKALLFLLAAVTPLVARGDIYAIGNSLTVDAGAQLLDGFGGWHIRASQTLPFIYANPSDFTYGYGVPAPWDIALASHQYDVVTVQPYSGTIADNVAAISAWMAMQPSADFVLHTSWPKLSQFSDGSAAAVISHAEAILAGLRADFPGRTIYRDRAVDALLHISHDIANGVGPFDSLGELYRDDPHLTVGLGAHADDQGEGTYLVHNVLRSALGQPLFTTFRPAIEPDTRAYLNGVIAQVTAVPEASQLLLMGAVAIAAVGVYAERRR